jgi:suppressor for copper-sensitivity B
MAVALLGTAAWLLILIDATAGMLPASLVGLALIAGLITLRWRAAQPEPRAALIAAGMLTAVVGTAIAVKEPPNPAEPSASDIQWRSMADLDALVRSGQTVFVDITADWCVTCKVNKALVINDAAILRRLSTDVVPVRADWTRPDPRIGGYVNSFGRYGLPFNAVFGPHAPAGIVLPELLTKQAVLAAFAQSSGAAQAPAAEK